jgi:NADPH2:quinone reductase
MRAWRCNTYGDYNDLVIEEHPNRDPGPGEVLVRPRASCITFVEMLMVQGKYQHKPDLPFTPGGECGGDVVAVGEGVTRFKPGDKVMAGGGIGLHGGSFAELMIASDAGCNPLPTPFGYAEGAAFMSAYITAYVSLAIRGQLQAGETLLVHGAAGGVGLAAVELGKHMGATVIATAGSDDKMAVLRQKGADHVINYTLGEKGEHFRNQVKDLTGGLGADVIYDPVGGDVFDESVRCIAPFGRLLVIGFTSGRIPTVPVNMPLIKQFSVVGVRAGEYGRLNPEGGRQSRQAILDMAEAGHLMPHIHCHIPFEGLIDAFDEIDARKVIGRMVLDINQ